MGIVHKLQHWWGGQGPRIQVRDFVPKDHYLRLWADTFPWQEMVEAVETSLARRFPKETIQGRPGVSMRVLLALEVLKAELACSDEDLCRRLRTDFAVMYVCGIEQVQADAPILKGKSNCPAQFGKKPGLVAEMATGFIFGLHLPVGNPEDAAYLMPLLD